MLMPRHRCGCGNSATKAEGNGPSKIASKQDMTACAGVHQRITRVDGQLGTGYAQSGVHSGVPHRMRHGYAMLCFKEALWEGQCRDGGSTVDLCK
jgi:hypothetical protein